MNQNSTARRRALIAELAAEYPDELTCAITTCPLIRKWLTDHGAVLPPPPTAAPQDTAAGSSLGTGGLPPEDILDHLLDGQDVMQKLHISPRTLQTLRSNGTIPYIKIGHKIYYHRNDIDRVLRSSYVMFKIRERYGK